jgi:dUTPase
MNFLFFEKLTENATTPYRIKNFPSSFQLLSAYDYTIRYKSFNHVLTDIKVTLPNDCFGLVFGNPQTKNYEQINVNAGFIGQESNNIAVTMINNNKCTEDFIIKKGDIIGQLIIVKHKADLETFEICRNSNIAKFEEERKSEEENEREVVERLRCLDKECKSCK